MPSPSTILIDVELPDPTPVPEPIVSLVSSLRVVLLGWYEVPEQTSPEQARDQFAEEAAVSLDRVAQPFRDTGADVHTRLVFTGEMLDTLSRISVEESCDAVYVSRPLDQLQRILVPLRGAPNLASIGTFVANLVREHPVDITLMHVIEEGETDESTRTTLFQPIHDRVEALEKDPSSITDRIVGADDPAQAIIDACRDYDLVVLGETDPTIREILFGSVPERIANEAGVPVIVVRHPEEVEEPETHASTGQDVGPSRS